MAFRKMLVVSGLVFAGSSFAAEPGRDDCIASSIQPEAIDLDKPRDQLARQNDLVIPEGARIGTIRILRRPIFDTTDPEQNNALYRTLNALNTSTLRDLSSARPPTGVLV
ncbi:hypothetical protein [Marinobacter sp.]|uniref:hypothetical protein n=1 Tax=Marinobacter sp. TaxID=50741 RepID=UPI003A939823